MENKIKSRSLGPDRMDPGPSPSETRGPSKSWGSSPRVSSWIANSSVSVAFCSPAKSLPLSGVMEHLFVGKKLKS